MPNHTVGYIQDIIHSNKGFFLLVFTSPNCSHCYGIESRMGFLKTEFNAKLIIVNADENRLLAEQYLVENLPTVLIYKKNDLIDCIVGHNPISRYFSKLNIAINN